MNSANIIKSKHEHVPFVFIRVDDVGYQNYSFLDLAEFLFDKGISFNVAVIPSEIKEIPDKILDILNNPKIYILQHGFNHGVNYYQNKKDYSEFHVTLDKRKNKDKLQKGKELFKEVFKTNKLGFVPPRHNFPQLDILLKENYNIISGYGQKIEIINNEMYSMPVNLDVINDYSLKKPYPIDIILEKANNLLDLCGFVGILLHHNFLPSNYSIMLDKLISFIQEKNLCFKKLDDLI